jgi:hypothetical protein
MARWQRRTRELSHKEPTWPVEDGANAVSEFAADLPGALSPFGEGPAFPLPVESLSYDHPGPEDRPNR